MRTPVAMALDAVLIILFAAIGRLAHHEALDVAGWAGTAWPFLVGGAVGWVIVATMLRRQPLPSQGVVVWADTLVLGMLLRVLTRQGTALPFIIVAAVSLAVFLLGWRAIYWFARGRREPRYPRKRV